MPPESPGLAARPLGARPLDFLMPLRAETDAASNPAGSGQRMRIVLWMLLGSASFGAALGIYGHHPLQMLASAIKVPVLLILTGALCFPSFHVLQALRAPDPRPLGEVLDLQARALGAMGVVWGALAPPLAVIIATTGHYTMAKLLAVLVGAVGGFFGLARLAAGWQGATGPTRLGLPVGLALYLATFGVVGAQLSWLMRPFLGSPSLEFQLFRDFHGDFFGHLWRILLG